MNDSDQDVPPEQLRTMQIIAGALPLGLAFFLGAALITAGGHEERPAPQLPLLSVVAAAMLVGCVPLSIILPKIITRTALRQILDGTFKIPEGAASEQFSSTTAKLLSVRQTTMIVGMALLEGAGFMGCTAYIVEHQVQVLGVTGVAILAILIRFPTRGQVSAWLDQQAQTLADMQRARNSGMR
jgi:hypothetical protein